jgi:TRAP-type C4-dicarboxylate transport system substrate-binding protein
VRQNVDGIKTVGDPASKVSDEMRILGRLMFPFYERHDPLSRRCAMANKVRFIVMIIIGIVAFGSAHPDVLQAQAKKVTWQLPTTEASHDDWTVKAIDEYAAAVGKRTQDNFKIVVSLGGELGINREELPRALASGRIQSASLPAGHVAGTFPFLNVFGLPFLISSLDEGLKVGKAVKPITEREFKKVGIYPVAFFVMTPVGLWSRVEIKDLTTLGNLKVRAWDESTSDIVKALGGVPIIMPVTEVYTALQRGVIDAVLTGAPAMLNVSGQELCKFGYLVNLAPACVNIAHSIKAFEALPKEYQTVYLEEAKKFEEHMVKIQPVENNKSLDRMKQAGVKLITPTSQDMGKVKDKVKFLWQRWADRNGPVAAEAMKAATESLGMK